MWSPSLSELVLEAFLTRLFSIHTLVNKNNNNHLVPQGKPSDECTRPRETLSPIPVTQASDPARHPWVEGDRLVFHRLFVSQVYPPYVWLSQV